MDEVTLNEAVENISLIKGVIDRTSKSFSGFSKIFIFWGVLFVFNSIITLFVQMNKEQFTDLFTKYHLMGYLFPVGLIALVAALIYWKISRKIPLVGLEKHLMTVWMLILVMNVIPHKIMVSSMSSGIDLKTITVQTNNFSSMLFSLAVGLIVTALLTEFKPLMRLGIVYILISIIYAYSNLMTPFDQMVSFLCLLALPFTFLFTGFYLKSQQGGGNRLGH